MKRPWFIQVVEFGSYAAFAAVAFLAFCAIFGGLSEGWAYSFKMGGVAALLLLLACTLKSICYLHERLELAEMNERRSRRRAKILSDATAA